MHRAFFLTDPAYVRKAPSAVYREAARAFLAKEGTAEGPADSERGEREIQLGHAHASVASKTFEAACASA
jgi:hypothetical protein